MANPDHPVRRALTRFFGLVLRTYFRKVEVVGHVPAKDVRGRLFAANHVNALVDPILVVTSAECSISPIAKNTLWNIPFFKWMLDLVDAVPIVRRRDDPGKSAKDNDAVFERVASHLVAGGNILIFPEGTSHNEPFLVPFRSGAGRMLARAKAAGGEGLEVQAVGLEFDERQIFRSRVLVVYGKVIRIDDLGELGTDALAERITSTLREELTELVVEGKTWEERVLMTRVADLLANEADDPTLEGRNVLGRQVEAARRLLGDQDPVIDEVRAKVAVYYEALGSARTSDVVVRDPKAHLQGRSLLALALLVLTIPLAVLGSILYFLPYQVPRLVVRATREESTDLTSTYKLGAGLLLFPLWAAVACTLAAGLLRHGNAAPVLVTCLGIVASPFAALAWLDRWPHLADTFGLVLGSGRGRLPELRALRAEALAAIETGRLRTQGASGDSRAT